MIRSDKLNRCIYNIATKTAEYTFFSGAHGTFSRIDNMLDLSNKYQ